jgi:phage baseplate assembly protein gpV
LSEIWSRGHVGDGNPPFRLGIVQQVDAEAARVRVTFPDYDAMLSWWLPIVVMKSQNDKAYWMPDIGEQVVCLMDLRDEAGAVLGSIYSAEDTPPASSADKWRLQFRDGTSVEYDRSSHQLRCALSDGAAISYDGGAHKLSMQFSDNADIAYDAQAHRLTIAGVGQVSIASSGGTTIRDDNAGVTIASGQSRVQVTPQGVSITPPLPTSSTVAQT